MKRTSKVHQLRVQAEARLNPGHAAHGTKENAPLALALIHDLASSPDTAPDALVLLHELQVHQVEIDMQAEALRTALADQEAALARQTEIHERMPVACLTLDRQTRIHEINTAGSKLLGMDKPALLKQTLGAFLNPQSQDELGRLLSGVDRNVEAGTIQLTLLTESGPARQVFACASAASEPDRYLIACMMAP